MASRLARMLLTALAPNLRYRVRGSAPALYLSFDDGPHSRTAAILDTLARHKVRASFFILGNRIAGREQLLRRMVAEGHTVGAHSYSHRSPRRLNRQQLQEEHLRCTRAITAVLPNWRPTLYRPPYGHLSWNLLRCSREVPFDIVLWSRDARDYRAKSTHAIAHNLGTLEAGDILLFHDQFQLTRDYLDEMIPRYRAEGFRFEALESAAPSRPAIAPELTADCLPDRTGTIAGRRH
ncbi:polysaccharide deacetylase family protein [Alkalilimnicola sp. S0819]|uniref:polysaccharide deacetylase family protein n=1 Tax=Alkalilimnicola sp. S0819 TaxID=2613922 RepID=UPI00126169DC|nr:polysaccharide deacetylase family protein [Alkalilimnicola sp. S0819]KAB7622857.1 polysaccharide deacetylase family protein [Alkalilimnicola sp. S0819]MPQ17179.1 polysaccharide deacetylase family protein [Alkalilimnicola sp. S0819]